MSRKINIAIDRYQDPKIFLLDLYNELKRSEDSMSYERFSEYLGFGHNTYSHQIISGRIKITEKASERICKAISLRGLAKKYFQTLCRYTYAKTQLKKEAALQEVLELHTKFLEKDLDKGQVEYFSKWYHSVIREMVLLPDFSADPEWIAKRIQPGITNKEAAESLLLLQKIGYIIFSDLENRWIQTEALVRTPNELKSLSIIRFHQHMIDLAKESITSTTAAKRDVSALTLKLTGNQFKELKERILKFRDQIIEEQMNQSAQIETSEKDDEIFQLNIQLFPLSRENKK